MEVVAEMKVVGLILALLLAATGSAFAQDTNATLTGRVTDASHAVLPGASVTVTDLTTNAVRHTKTNKAGDYSVSNLVPGMYSVVIEMQGFKSVEQPSVTLETAQIARLDVTMVVGAVTETVNVTTQVGAIDTDTSDKGDVIAQVEISEMPLNGRDFNDLVFNVAGVSTSEEGSKGAAFVANGVRSDQSNVIVDGVNNTNPRDSTAAATPPLDALQEFKVQTSGYSAEYGRVAGPVINLQIKKGGNKITGSIFEFVRNDFMDAGNYFDVKGTKSELRRNQFGGTVSGPVVIPHIYDGHDKTFFVVSEESYREVAGQDTIGVVPTLAERQGDFSQSIDQSTGQPFSANPNQGLYDPVNNMTFANWVVPKQYWDPVATQLMNQFYPLPTVGLLLPAGNNYIVNEKGYTYWDNVLAKIDQQIGAHDEANFKFDFRHENTLNPFGGSDTGLWPSRQARREYIYSFNETHLFSANVINDFRIGLTRQTNDEHPVDRGTNWAAALGIPGTTSDPNLAQFPYFNVNGYETLGDSTQQPVQYIDNNYDTTDTVTWSKGKHTIRMGGDMLKVQYFQPTNSGFSGSISFSGKTSLDSNGFAEFLEGASTSTDLRIGTVTNHLHDTSYAAFVQDDYKATANLTLNLGLRYELETMPYEENNQFSNFIPAVGKTLIAAAETPALDALIGSLSSKNVPGTTLIGYAAQYGYPRTLIYPNYNRLAPRVGFAWRPSANEMSVIRGGYGIFYMGSRLTVIRTELSGAFPFSQSLSCGAATKVPFEQAFSGAALAGCSNKFTSNGYDPHAPSPYVQSYNLTYEHEQPKGLAVEIAYTGSHGVHQGRQYDINQVNAINPQCPSPAKAGTLRAFCNNSTINFFSFDAYSHYDAGTVTLRKRYNRGLMFRLNFTYGKTLDLQSGLNYAGNGGFKGVQDIAHPQAEYGRADSDRNLILSGNFVYLLPFKKSILLKGWETAGSVQASSGLPFTPQLNGPTNDSGVATRPNRVCKGTLAHPTVNAWFNVACFPQTSGAVGDFGNSGRNILTGPSYVQINMSLLRNFRITDRQKLQLRWEVFNVPNHPNFATPNDNVDEPNVGSITSAKDPRVMQLGAKYLF